MQPTFFGAQNSKPEIHGGINFLASFPGMAPLQANFAGLGQSVSMALPPMNASMSDFAFALRPALSQVVGFAGSVTALLGAAALTTGAVLEAIPLSVVAAGAGVLLTGVSAGDYVLHPHGWTHTAIDHLQYMGSKALSPKNNNPTPIHALNGGKGPNEENPLLKFGLVAGALYAGYKLLNPEKLALSHDDEQDPVEKIHPAMEAFLQEIENYEKDDSECSSLNQESLVRIVQGYALMSGALSQYRHQTSKMRHGVLLLQNQAILNKNNIQKLDLSIKQKLVSDIPQIKSEFEGYKREVNQFIKNQGKNPNEACLPDAMNNKKDFSALKEKLNAMKDALDNYLQTVISEMEMLNQFSETLLKKTTLTRIK